MRDDNVRPTDAWVDALMCSRSIQRLAVLAEDSQDPEAVRELLTAMRVLAAHISAAAEVNQAQA